MFDVSFSELALILVVGLLVFGPEKLPEVVRTAGLWIGKIKRTFTQMRTEIEREMGVDELKRDLHNNTIMQNLKDVQNNLQRAEQELNLPYKVSDVVQRANATATPVTTVETDALAPTALPADTPKMTSAAIPVAPAPHEHSIQNQTTSDRPTPQ